MRRHRIYPQARTYRQSAVFDSKKTKESSGKVRDLGWHSGRGHCGCGYGWLFEQQIQYKLIRAGR
jgi:hypothetical protein